MESSLTTIIFNFLKSDIFGIIAGFASIIPFTILVVKYVIKPIKIRFSHKNLNILNLERDYIKRIINEMDLLDRATYWEDLLYTPLEAHLTSIQTIPPEFLVLKESSQKPQKKALFGILYDLNLGKFKRYSDICKVFKRYHEPLIVLGDPGSGKSVSFRHAVRKIAKTELRWYKTKPLIPIYIPCGQYVEKNNGYPLTIEKFILTFVEKRFHSFLKKGMDFNTYLEQGRLIIFFDALDEMPRIDYAERINLLREFSIRYSHNSIFFSCRKMDYDKRLQVKEINIRPFDKDRRHSFLKKSLLREFSPKKVNALIYQLETDSKLSDLLSNPFFCQLVIFYVLSTKDIPRNRYQLFDLYINKRLSNEKSRWKANWPSIENTIIELSKLGYVIASKKGIGTSLYYKDAIKYLSTFSEFDNEGIKEIIEIGLRSKLLLLVPESEHLQFTHHRLQEYFAALYASENISWNHDTIKRFTDDLWWREILIMIMGMDESHEDKIESIIEYTTFLVRNIFEDIINSCQNIINDIISNRETNSINQVLKIMDHLISEYLKYFDPFENDEELISNLIYLENLNSILPDFSEKEIQKPIFFNLAKYIEQKYGKNEETIYDKILKKISPELRKNIPALRTIRRLTVNRISLATACSTNCNLSIVSKIWEKLKKISISILDYGNPTEKLKLVKELINKDDDIDINKKIRKLLKSGSHWVRSEIFNILLHFRIPHVGFDKWSIGFLWSEFNYRGIVGIIREYSGKLLKSFIKGKAVVVFSVLFLIHIILITFFSGVLPFITHHITSWSIWGNQFIIKPSIVKPICFWSSIIFLSASIFFRNMRSMAISVGIFLTIGLIGWTIDVNSNPIKEVVEQPEGSNIYIYAIIGIILLIVLLTTIVPLIINLIIYIIQRIRFFFFSRSLMKDGIISESQDSIERLISYYKSSKNNQTKVIILEYITHHVNIDDEVISKLTELAYIENDGNLADRLWEMIYEFEKRVQRVESSVEA